MSKKDKKYGIGILKIDVPYNHHLECRLEVLAEKANCRVSDLMLTMLHNGVRERENLYYSDLEFKGDDSKTAYQNFEELVQKRALKQDLLSCGILRTEIPYSNNLADNLETLAAKMNWTVPELMFTILNKGMGELSDLLKPLEDFNSYKRSLLEDDEKYDGPGKPVVKTVLLTKEKDDDGDKDDKDDGDDGEKGEGKPTERVTLLGLDTLSDLLKPLEDFNSHRRSLLEDDEDEDE